MEATKILKLVNEERQAEGKQSLKENQYLKEAADKKIMDMKNRDYFSHQDKSGNNIVSFLPQEYQYSVLGENLAFGFKNEESLIKAWMKSQTHRSNILEKDFKDTAVSILPFQEKFLAVQVFGITQQEFLEQKNDNPSKEMSQTSFFLSLILFLLVTGLLLLSLVRKKK